MGEDGSGSLPGHERLWQLYRRGAPCPVCDVLGGNEIGACPACERFGDWLQEHHPELFRRPPRRQFGWSRAAGSNVIHLFDDTEPF